MDEMVDAMGKKNRGKQPNNPPTAKTTNRDNNADGNKDPKYNDRPPCNTT